MAIITLPPVLIDPTNFSRMSFNEETSFGKSDGSGGPYQVGSNLYMFLGGGGDNSGDAPLDVWKSTDDGLTWVAQDRSSADKPHPLATAGLDSPGRSTFASGIIQVAFPPSASGEEFIIYLFDTSTDSWITPTSLSGASSSSLNFSMSRCPNGDIILAYTRYATTKHTVYQRYSGGSWSGQVDLDSNANGLFVGAMVADSSNVTHVFYVRGPQGVGTRTLYYNQIDAAGAAGSPVALSTSPAGFNIGRAVIWGTHVICPYVDKDGASLTPMVQDGTPLAAPVFSQRAAGSSISNTWVLDTLDSCLDKDGNLIVGWCQSETVQVNDTIQIARDTGSGFAAQELFYDAGANPLVYTGVTVSSSCHSLYLFNDNNDGWFALTAVDMGGLFGFPCGGIFLAAPGATTPTITCPVLSTGTIGIFFTTTATATGGTPPYTYSITSGSLPPGITMTQDGTTATFSGTPLSAGSFSFTLTVTDSLGATDTVDAPCPLTIANTPPPEFCEITPAGASPELVAYNEPLERTGS